MSLLDFIKALVPDSLVKINIKNDNRQIIVKDSEIIVNGTKITDKQVIDKVYKEINDIDKKNETLPFQVIHENLLKDYLEYEQLSIDQNVTMKLLKEALPEEEIECIFMARRVYLAFKSTNRLKATELEKKLDENYPKKGKKVLNLMSAGYFDELIVPFIDVLKEYYGDNYKLEYTKFYTDLLAFCPVAIFVGNNVNEKKIEEELNKRIALNIPVVKLHALGDNNIKKIQNVVTKLKISQKYSVKDNRYAAPSGIKAEIYEIKIKST
jgi:hypothetical protein